MHVRVTWKAFPTKPRIGCVRELSEATWSWSTGDLGSSSDLDSIWCQWLDNMESTLCDQFGIFGPDRPQCTGRSRGFQRKK
eukprot:8372671-Pyramimonas_sp.AAC.1